MIPAEAVEAAAAAIQVRMDQTIGLNKLAQAALEAAAPQIFRRITASEELDELPVGSVVLADGYLHHANGMPIAFQRWTDGAWHRGARSSDTHPDNIVPAVVLYRPAA